MNVVETDCDEPDRLAEQGEHHSGENQKPINDQVVKHDMRVKSQRGDDHDYWKERVPIAKKEISNGDIPEMQLIAVLFALRH
jgi:hypothetical protein